MILEEEVILGLAAEEVVAEAGKAKILYVGKGLESIRPKNTFHR
jgi:hypothetical protein